LAIPRRGVWIVEHADVVRDVEAAVRFRDRRLAGESIRVGLAAT
jgi:hypothetical protein